MRYGRRTKMLFLLILTIVIMLPVKSAFADANCGGVDTVLLSCDDGDGKGVYHILQLILDILTIGVGMLGVVGVSWSGINILTAGNDEAKLAKSKRRLFELLIGIACYAVLFGLAKWLLPGGTFDVETAEENSGIIEGAGGTSSSSSGNSGNGSSGSSSSSNSSGKKKATVSEKNRENMIAMKKNASNVTIVGDSITYYTRGAGGYKSKMKKADIYCQCGKRMFNDDKAHGGTAGNGGASGNTIITNLISQKKLRPIVVIALGSNDAGNAALTATALQGLVDKINKDGKHSIYFITNYNYYKKGNSKFKKVNYSKNNSAFKAMQKNNDNVMVINWAGIVGENPSKYMRDYVHPKNGAGTTLFANTIYRALTNQ